MSNDSRRKLLKALASGGGAVIAGKNLPEKWAKPVVDSVVLPAHAQASAPLPPPCTHRLVARNQAGTEIESGGVITAIDKFAFIGSITPIPDPVVPVVVSVTFGAGAPIDLPPADTDEFGEYDSNVTFANINSGTIISATAVAEGISDCSTATWTATVTAS